MTLERLKLTRQYKPTSWKTILQLDEEQRKAEEINNPPKPQPAPSWLEGVSRPLPEAEFNIPIAKTLKKGLDVWGSLDFAGKQPVEQLGKEIREGKLSALTALRAFQMSPAIGMTGNLTPKLLNIGKVIPKKGIVPTVTIPKHITISSPAELETKAAQQAIGGKLGSLYRQPVVSNVGRIINPIAIDDNAPSKLKAIAGTIDDQIIGGTKFQMSPVNKVSNILKTFEISDAGVQSKNITQIKPLAGGVESKQLHDIIENVNSYDFGTGKIASDQKRFIQTIRDTSKQFSDMLREEGILVDKKMNPGQIQAIKGESDFQFLHRVLLTVKEDDAEGLASNLQKVLSKEDIVFSKLPNETNYAWMARFADNVANGKISITDNVNSLLDDFANLADVKVKKSSIEAKRSWATTAEGLKAGNIYESNPIVELRKQGEASYQLVKNKRLSDVVQDMLKTTTPEEETSKILGKDYFAIRQASDNSQKLVSYFQRIKRGESVSGGVTTFIRTNYPDLATRLDDATALLPTQTNKLINRIISSVSKAGKITSKEKKILSQEIKSSIQSRGRLTLGSISDVITPVLKDKRDAIKIARQTYLDLSAKQMESINSLLDEAKSRQLIDTELFQKANAIKSKYTERMGTLGTAEYGRVVGMPGLGDRVLVTQQGMTGRELALELQDYFGYMPARGADVAVQAIGKVGALMRMGRLGFDVSTLFIQQLMSLGYDVKNLVRGRPTAVWAKSTGGVFRTLLSKDMQHLDDFTIKNADIIRDFVQRNGLFETAEITEAENLIKNFLDKAPSHYKLSEIAGFIEKHIVHRSDAVFTTGRVESAINMYKAGYKAAQMAGKLDDWAKTVNLMTGILSTRGMGVSSGQRAIESGFALLSPRFTRANLAIMYHIAMNPKSYTAKEAAQSLTGLILATTAAYSTIQKAQGKDVNLNPFDTDALKVEIGDEKYYLGGILADIRRMLQVIDTLTYYSTGERLSLSGREDKTPKLDVLLFRQAQAKTSPITGTNIDITRMVTDPGATDWQGRPLSWRTIISNWITPASLEPAINEGSIPATLASEVGISTSSSRASNSVTSQNYPKLKGLKGGGQTRFKLKGLR